MNMGWVYSLNHLISPWHISWDLPRFVAKFQSFVDMSGHNVVWTHPYAHPQHIKVVKHLLYIHNIDVRWIWVGSIASITSFHHDISAETCPDLRQNSKSLVDMSGHNVVWTHPYAHPQHVKVVKHLLYIHNIDVRWIWVGSTASITSFYHDISAETCPDLWQNSKSLVDMSGHNVVWTHPYAHPQHVKVVKHLLSI